VAQLFLWPDIIEPPFPMWRPTSTTGPAGRILKRRQASESRAARAAERDTALQGSPAASTGLSTFGTVEAAVVYQGTASAAP